MAKYVKLGKTASLFVDATSGLKVTPNKVVKLPKKVSKRIEQGLRHNHLVKCSEDEYNESLAEESSTSEDDTNLDEGVDYKKMKVDELNDHYAENYEPTEQEAAEFADLKKKDKIKFLIEKDEEETETE